jgi:hypothetical protein
MLFIDSRKGRRSGALCVTKIMLVMRWTAALLLAACLQVSAQGLFPANYPLGRECSTEESFYENTAANGPVFSL